MSDYDPLARSFRLSLRAENRASTTVSSYMAAVDQLGMFLRDRGIPLIVADLRRDHR